MESVCFCGHDIETHSGTMGCCVGLVQDAEGCGDSCSCPRFVAFVPSHPCGICGAQRLHRDPRDHQGRPHGVATGDGRTRADIQVKPEPEPTEPGWYAYSGGAQTMIFLLTLRGKWYVAFDNGMMDPCTWDYIAQALSVWKLVRFQPGRLAEIADARR